MALTMSLIDFVVVLFGITCCIFRASASDKAPNIVSVQGSTHFANVIANNTFTFIKFFHPRCPHCRAMAPHFNELAVKISERNANPGLSERQYINVAEVDASRKENAKVVLAHADGFPTLKLFKSGRIVSEYEGQRRSDAMLDFITSELRFDSSPLVELLNTTDQMNAFLKRESHRPVVLSVFHHKTDMKKLYPEHARPCPISWRAAAGRMRNSSAPNVAFGAVKDPSLLIPLSKPHLERFIRLRRVTFAPALAASPSGENFWRHASWWFPGIREEDSMETFMHVVTVGGKGYVVLDDYNSRHLLSSTKPLVLVFGNEARPRWRDQAFLQEASRIPVVPRLLALYANSSQHAAFAEHVGVLRETLNESRSESLYVFYRTAVSGSTTAMYDRHSGKSASVWLAEQAKKVNRSNIAIPAGKVLELDADTWDHAFEYDGRGVLLLLYHSDCLVCKRFARTYNRVANMMAPHAGAVVVTRFDMKKYSLPLYPELPKGRHVPSIYYVAPGAAAVEFEGTLTHRAIAKFARAQAELDDVSFDALSVLESGPFRLFQIGLLLMCSGIAISRRARGTKRVHVT